MLHKYRYLGRGNLDAIALGLRRDGWTAYVETERGESILITDYTLYSLSFRYLGAVHND